MRASKLTAYNLERRRKRAIARMADILAKDPGDIRVLGTCYVPRYGCRYIFFAIGPIFIRSVQLLGISGITDEVIYYCEGRDCEELTTYTTAGEVTRESSTLIADTVNLVVSSIFREADLII